MSQRRSNTLGLVVVGVAPTQNLPKIGQPSFEVICWLRRIFVKGASFFGYVPWTPAAAPTR